MCAFLGSAICIECEHVQYKLCLLMNSTFGVEQLRTFYTSLSIIVWMPLRCMMRNSLWRVEGSFSTNCGKNSRALFDENCYFKLSLQLQELLWCIFQRNLWIGNFNGWIIIQDVYLLQIAVYLLIKFIHWKKVNVKKPFGDSRSKKELKFDRQSKQNEITN